MNEGKVKLVINTPTGRGGKLDEAIIRENTISMNVPCITTIAAARAAVDGIRALKTSEYGGARDSGLLPGLTAALACLRDFSSSGSTAVHRCLP